MWRVWNIEEQEVGGAQVRTGSRWGTSENGSRRGIDGNRKQEEHVHGNTVFISTNLCLQFG